MNKSFMSRLLNKTAVISLLVFLVSLTGCGDKVTFSGSKTSNANQFLVDFDVLNTTVSSQMALLVDDTIEVTIDIEKGTIDIIVESELGSIAYQGNDAENGHFYIIIQEAGTYTFTLTGVKAKGSVHFSKYLP